jgi:hypothetical protein
VKIVEVDRLTLDVRTVNVGLEIEVGENNI